MFQILFTYQRQWFIRKENDFRNLDLYQLREIKKKIKSQTVVSRTLWGYFFLFFGTHRFKFLCSFEHLRVFLGTMLGPVDGRGVWKRQHGAPQRWSRGWKLIEGIVEHPCVRHCCSICRPVSNDSIDGTDTRKVTLCTNSCQMKDNLWFIFKIDWQCKWL